MSRALKIAIIAVLLLVVLGTVVAIVVALRSNTEESSAPPSMGTTDTVNLESANVSLPTNGTAVVADEQEEPQPTAPTASASPRDTALRLARLFVERYGSFSENNDYENVKNLLSLMTTRFRQESEKIIADAEAPDPNAEFYGITTKVLTIAMGDYVEDKKAVVQLQTQRTETDGAADSTVFTQPVRVSLVSVDGVWKVDSVTWE